MKKIEEHILLLNNELKDIINSKHFLFGNNWVPFRKLIDNFYSDGYSLSEQVDEVYTISSTKKFQSMMVSFIKLKKLAEEETFLNECIKQQKYDFVNNYRDKQKHIIKEINDIERIEIKDIENIFYFKIENQIFYKKFIDPEFNNYFLKMLNKEF